MKVSALIPTYNRREHIFRAIDSVLSQSVPVEEIIVVDDGSTDGTNLAIQEKYGSRIRIVSQKNSGVSFARRRGVQEAKCEWVAFLDSDDEWAPGRNAALSSAASSVEDDVAWIFGDSQFVRDEGNFASVFQENRLNIDGGIQIFRKPLTELPWSLEITRPPVVQSSLIRKSALMEFQCFSEGLRHGEDFLASIQVSSKYSLAGIPSVVTRIYRTSDLLSSSLEHTGISSIDVCKAGVFGYRLAAITTQGQQWKKLHAEFVRRLCKACAREGLPIRRLAAEQFVFDVSMKSLVFWCAAMLGSGFFRACFFAKNLVRSITGKNKGQTFVATSHQDIL